MNPRTCDLLCFSHLRWNFVFQRPQHLMTRFAKERRVYFVEEPLYGPGPTRMVLELSREGVRVATPLIEVPGATERSPHPPAGFHADEAELHRLQRGLLDGLIARESIDELDAWYYTPMALPFTRHLRPRVLVYDCMDELSHFQGAPPALLEREAELFALADVVFTGGQSLYEAKRKRHANVHPCPSSVDVAHFARARRDLEAPFDQAALPAPRMGFFGVVDERMDLELLAGLAAARPTWSLVILGPVVKIAPDALPRAANLHYLGGKPYDALPSYLAGWDVALMPFALNDATRFISPTKTPEYLAAGKPVVSTSIRDVVHPYGRDGLVEIADSVDGFVRAIEKALRTRRDAWLPRVDAFLSRTSWDQTWARMKDAMNHAAQKRRSPRWTAAQEASAQ